MSNEQQQNDFPLNPGFAELMLEEAQVLISLLESALKGETVIQVHPSHTEKYEGLLEKGFLVTDNNGTAISSKVTDIILMNIFTLQLPDSAVKEAADVDKFENVFDKHTSALPDPTDEAPEDPNAEKVDADVEASQASEGTQNNDASETNNTEQPGTQPADESPASTDEPTTEVDETAAAETETEQSTETNDQGAEVNTEVVNDANANVEKASVEDQPGTAIDENVEQPVADENKLQDDLAASQAQEQEKLAGATDTSETEKAVEEPSTEVDPNAEKQQPGVI